MLDKDLQAPGCYAIENVQNGHRYVGSSSNLLYRREGHFGNLRKDCHCNRHLQGAWNKYGEYSFIFHPVLFCEAFELLRYEQFLIDKWHPEYNTRLVASSNLGMKFGPHSEGTRRKISEAHKGKEPTEETRRKMSETRRGKKCKPRSEEHCWRISEALRGKKHGPMSEEHRARIAAAHKGMKFSDEHRKHISEAHKGVKRDPMSEECRKRISKANTNPSEETRKKMSDSRKRWHERRRMESSK